MDAGQIAPEAAPGARMHPNRRLKRRVKVVLVGETGMPPRHR